jgi:hypothetical protein
MGFQKKILQSLLKNGTTFRLIGREDVYTILRRNEDTNGLGSGMVVINQSMSTNAHMNVKKITRSDITLKVTSIFGTELTEEINLGDIDILVVGV